MTFERYASSCRGCRHLPATLRVFASQPGEHREPDNPDENLETYLFALSECARRVSRCCWLQGLRKFDTTPSVGHLACGHVCEGVAPTHFLYFDCRFQHHTGVHNPHMMPAILVDS